MIQPARGGLSGPVSFRRRFSLRWSIGVVGLVAVTSAIIRTLPTPWPAAFFLVIGVLFVLLIEGLTLPISVLILAMSYILTMMSLPGHPYHYPGRGQFQIKWSGGSGSSRAQRPPRDPLKGRPLGDYRPPASPRGLRSSETELMQ